MFMWGAGGLAMMLMMLVLWGLVIAGLVLGVRWLAGQGRGAGRDEALGRSCANAMPVATSTSKSSRRASAISAPQQGMRRAGGVQPMPSCARTGHSRRILANRATDAYTTEERESKQWQNFW